MQQKLPRGNDGSSLRDYRNSMEAGQRAVLLETNRIYTMLTGDEPTSTNLEKNGHKEEIAALYKALHGIWSYYWIGAPYGVYSLFQILPSGQQRLVISQVPTRFKALYLQNLFVILNSARYKIVEETKPGR